MVKPYRTVRRPGHPLAMASGDVYEHRAVLYDKIGPGIHPCHWCGVPLEWKGRKLRAVHLDGDLANNAPANIAAACYHCMKARGQEDAFAAHVAAARFGGLTLSQQYPREMLPVKVIPLTRGYFAIIDPEDFDLIGPYKWCVSIGRSGPPYAVRRITTAGVARVVKMQEVIMGGTWADHVNRLGNDNRRSNLRAATAAQNLANTGPHKDGRSGFKGVTLPRNRRRWLAQIAIGGQHRVLGRFSAPEDAARAYDHAAIEAAGEFACTNHSLGLVSHETCNTLCPVAAGIEIRKFTA